MNQKEIEVPIAQGKAVKHESLSHPGVYLYLYADPVTGALRISVTSPDEDSAVDMLAFLRLNLLDEIRKCTDGWELVSDEELAYVMKDEE